MNSIRYGFWLAEGAWDALCYFWPVTLVLVAAVVAAFILNSPFHRSKFQRHHLLVLLPLGVSLLILVWGSLWRHTGQSVAVAEWPSQVVFGLLVAQLLCAIGVVYALKGYRWFSVAVVLLEQWVGVSFAIVAAMSVSGDWL